MALVITNEDFHLIKQPSVECHLKIEVLNENETIINSLEGIIQGGTQNIDANSDIRRTCSFSIIPTHKQELLINETSYLWLNKAIKIQVGIKNLITDEITWYKQGYFLYTDTSGNYDANNNILQVNCGDFMTLFDGTRNGTLGQYQIKIPAYKENTNTGEVIEYNYIRDAMIYTVGQLGRIKDIKIEEIGEFKGLEDKNPGTISKSEYDSSDTIKITNINLQEAKKYISDIQIGDYVKATGFIQYRLNNPTWNCVPYDLEFSAGDNVLKIITTLRDLYPNYETFFDIDNVFVCQMKPSGYNDAVILTNEQIQSILVSEGTESTKIRYTEVKNISEVWGDVIEADFYTESGVTYSDNVYYVPNSAYVGSESRYYNGDKIAVKIPKTNLNNPSMNIQSLGAIPIYDGQNLYPLKEGVLLEGRTYTFKIKRSYSSNDSQYNTRAIYLGQYQPHGMTVLLNYDRHSETYTTNTGVTVELYSAEYFKELYGVSPQALTRTINPDSPFAIEKIGSILQVEQKSECISDDLALSQSNYNNFISTRLTDNITITTLLSPFLDVNIKVEYKPYNSESVNQYIIDSISHDFENGTTSITMHRFYPLYSWL